MMASDATTEKTKERCRTCGEPIDETTRSFPFCSPRCRGADLGAWFNEDYKISREIKDSDLETVD